MYNVEEISFGKLFQIDFLII